MKNLLHAYDPFLTITYGHLQLILQQSVIVMESPMSIIVDKLDNGEVVVLCWVMVSVKNNFL